MIQTLAMELKLPECLQTFKMVAAPASCPETPESLNSICFIAESVNDGPLEEHLPPHQLLTDNQLKALLDQDRRLVRMDQQNLQTLAEGSLSRSDANQRISQGIAPDALIDPTPVSKTNEFVDQRVREPHSIIHGLTGFELQGNSERGIESFNTAQTVRSSSNTDCCGNAQQPAKR